MEGRFKKYSRNFLKRSITVMVLGILMLSIGLGFLREVRAATAPSRIIMYQGRLLNSNGVPVSDTTASISFALYDASSSGTCLWSNSSATCASTTARTVTLNSGLFSEPLGDTNNSYAAIAATVFADNASVYLQVVVNGETLTPRKQMLATPYAINSDTLDGYSTTTSGATSSAVPVFDSSGNLTITGSPQGAGVSQGSLYVNPASGVVAANEILFGVGVSGSSRFTVDGEGDAVVAGNFIAGASTLAAPFSVDSASQIMRFGTGSTTDPTLNFYASDASTGSLSYVSGDSWSMTGGNFAHTGLNQYTSSAAGTVASLTSATTLSGTSTNALGAIKNYSVSGTLSYSGLEGTGNSHDISGVFGSLAPSGSSTVITYGSGVKGNVTNASTNASLLETGGYLSAVTGIATQNATATTLGDMRGIYGEITASLGTITNAYAVSGQFSSGSGSITTGYSLYGKNTAAGTSRYGVYGEASGGTNNFAGYFTGGRVQIDANDTPDTPSIASSAGELYVSGDLEARGSLSLGDGVGSADTFSLTTNATTEMVAQIAAGSLTTGSGMYIVRGDNGTDFSGNLLLVEQNDTATALGTVAQITQLGTGSAAMGLRITQSTTSAHVANSVGNTALVIDINEVASTDDAIMMRSDADGTADTEFRVTSAGDAFADGAFTGAGADFAEYFPTNDPLLQEQLLACYDSLIANGVKRCEAGNRHVVGVISTNPAFIGNVVGDGTEDYRHDARYRLVGLTGQIDTRVTAADGAIAIGDPIATSSSVPGYGAKAQGPVRIVGFALEALSSGTGTIRVLVDPQWYGGDVLTRFGAATQVTGSLAIASSATATATSIAADSSSLALRGSAWNGTAAETVTMSLQTSVDSLAEYGLAVVNTGGDQVMTVSRRGDVGLAGKFYLSDRGVAQHEKYLYYDGSEGSGGDFIRTNASGWGTGSYDFAEMFPSSDALIAGEIVVFGDQAQHVKRSIGEEYSSTIAGIVSTKPGFLAGENQPGSYPIALAGRVPTYVSGENGDIHIGDPLTTAKQPGYAMKATQPGPIVGYAAESFSGTLGKIVVYVNVSYFNGTPTAQAPAARNVLSGFMKDIEDFDLTKELNLHGGRFVNVGALVGAQNVWRLESDGDFITTGRITQLVNSATGASVETYVAATRQMTVQLSGTAKLINGSALVNFADVDALFADIIDTQPTYRVFVTPYGATGTLLVTNRTREGFTITESHGSSDEIAVDWLVIADRRDFVSSVVTPTIPEELHESPSEGGGHEGVEPSLHEHVLQPASDVIDSSEVLDHVLLDGDVGGETIVDTEEVSAEIVSAEEIEGSAPSEGVALTEELGHVSSDQPVESLPLSSADALSP